MSRMHLSERIGKKGEVGNVPKRDVFAQIVADQIPTPPAKEERLSAE